MPDLLVLGHGIAGAAAALAARTVGARVTLVASSPGATALSSGGWRGPFPEALAAALAAGGHPLGAAPAPLPSVVGCLEQVDAAPPWHLAAAPAAGTLVCGIAGLPAFSASFLARAWGAGASVQLELRGTPDGGWSPVALAAAVERDPRLLADRFAQVARDHGAERVVLPAVLGLEQPITVWRAVRELAGVEVGEALGGLPSLPGWRLDRALSRALAAAGVELVRDRAVGAVVEGGRVTAVRLAGGGELRPAAIVLATGKFVGGGIVASPSLDESALGLPIVLEHLGERFRDSAPLLTTQMERAGDQPLLRAGVRVDGGGRPLAADGSAAATNVRVAGSVRDGWDAALTGLGHAAADGWAAGLSAVEAA